MLVLPCFAQRLASAAAAALVLLLVETSCGGAGNSPSAAASATAATPNPEVGNQAAGPAASRPRPKDLETYMILFDLGIYESKIAPAFDKYVATGDASGLEKLTSQPVPVLANRKQRLEAAQKLAAPIVEARCLVKLPGADPYQLGASELVSYLFSASDWLRETLTARDISDVALDYPVGEITEIIRPVDAAEIRVNIRNIPMPEDAGIKKQLAGLLAMMDAAAKNPKQALAMVMK